MTGTCRLGKVLIPLSCFSLCWCFGGSTWACLVVRAFFTAFFLFLRPEAPELALLVLVIVSLVLAWQEQLSSQMGQSMSSASSRLVALASRLLDADVIMLVVVVVVVANKVTCPLGLERLLSLLLGCICREGEDDA